jgi:uncharacterized membrane protein
MRIPSNLTLFLVTAIGAVLRAADVWYHPLPRMDEVVTLQMVQYPALKIITTSMLTDFNPPLFYLAARAMVIIGGVSVAMARVPSIISGVLLIPMMYLIGKEIDDRQLGLLCAGFIALLSQAIYFSGYARSFAMVGVVFSATILAFIRILKGKDGWPVFAVSGLIALYIHAFAIVPLALMVLYLIHIRSARWRYLIGMFIGAIPFSLMMYVIATVRPAAGYAPQASWGWSIAGGIPLELFGLAAPLVILLILYTLKRYYARDDFPLIAVPTATCIAAVALSYFQLIYAEYVMLVLPMFAIFAVVPVAEWIKERNLNVAYPVVIFLVLQVVQLGWMW